jgi:hypothetical protein
MIPLMDAWTTRAPPAVNESRHASSVSETSLRVSVHGADRRLCGDAIRAADVAEGSWAVGQQQKKRANFRMRGVGACCRRVGVVAIP